MTLIKYQSSDIVPVALNIMSLSVVTFAEYGFKSALEGELKELKSLVGTEITDGSIFELLDGLEDEISRFVIRSIITIDDYITTFRLMHNIDLEELFEDQRIRTLSDDLYTVLFAYADGLVEKNLRMAMEELPLTVANALFYLCRLFLHGEINSSHVLENGLHGKGRNEFDFMNMSDNNVAVLHDLATDMLRLHEEICLIYTNGSDNSLP